MKFALAAAALACAALPATSSSGDGFDQQAGMVCFLKSERESDFNKICTYSCLSGDVAITIKATSMCPMSINRP